MKRLFLCLTVLLLLASLAPRLEAQTAISQPETARLSAPALAAALGLPAEPTNATDPAQALPGLMPTIPSAVFTCTYSQCLAQCSDCPWGHTNYCISTSPCRCGCR